MAIWSPHFLRCFFCASFLATVAPAPGLAQAVGPAPAEAPTVIGPSGEAYLKVLSLRRIDTDVRYYDPTRPAPALETRAQPETADSDTGSDTSDRVRVQIGLPALLVLIGVVALFWRFGGGFSVSLGREAANTRRGGGAQVAPDTAEAAPSTLRAILGIADRRAALLSLTATALARAITGQGLLFQKSWTGRDVLRNLPTETPLRGELQTLVYASERVHFGGHDVSEDEFRAHVARIRPLIEGGT